MPNSSVSHLEELRQLRQLFAEAAPTDLSTITNYGWIIAKCLNHEHEQLGSIDCRQLLLEYLRLPLERPSRLHSAILSAAVKVAGTYPDFRFAAFLRMWDIAFLRPEDRERQRTEDGRTFPSLAERVARALGHTLLLHPEDCPVREVPAATVPADSFAGLTSLLATHGLSIQPMLVTRIRQSEGKDGRKYTFVTLTSPEGVEIETISHSLQPSPLHPLPEGKRHYVNIGQLYDCLLSQKPAPVSGGSPVGQPSSSSSSSLSSSFSFSFSLKEAYFSQTDPTTIFPTEIGYLEAIDQQHGHMHIYDSHSRHFVAPVQRFSKERVGDFVRFIPIVPAASKFKTAIILGTIPPSSLLGTVPSTSEEGHPLLREIRITAINRDKGYAAWELVDKSSPITERLSPLQLSQGETSPTFTSGYINLTDELSSTACGEPVEPSSSFLAFIYLRRGKDHQKRPHIARLFPRK